MKSNRDVELVSLFSKVRHHVTPPGLEHETKGLKDQISEDIHSLRTRIKHLSSIQHENKRVREIHQKALAKSLYDIATEFQNIQQEAREEKEKEMRRQYRIARPNASEDEIETALDQPYKIFQEIMISKTTEERRVLEAVQSRNKELLDIERSIHELGQLFEDMSILIDSQQVMIDRIDHHIVESMEDVEKGGKELTGAIQYAKRSRRKKMCLCICLLIVLVAIVLGVLFGTDWGRKLLGLDDGKPPKTKSTAGSG